MKYSITHSIHFLHIKPRSDTNLFTEVDGGNILISFINSIHCFEALHFFLYIIRENIYRTTVLSVV